MATNTVQPQTTAQLLDSYTRELILLSGKDGVGKSSAIVSLAAFVQMTQPNATFYVIDSEHKFCSALKSYGSDAPTNIQYYAINDMNQATTAMATILGTAKPHDWIAVESMARIWERAQDMTYLAVAGVGKIDYLEMKTNTVTPTGITRKGSPIPDPDNFWQICKGAHDGAFLDAMINRDDLNVVLTTTVKAPPKERTNREESKDRKILRAELGIDLNMDGAPRLPYYASTTCLLEMVGGRVSCRVLRDNNSQRDNTRPTFDVPDRRSWAMAFYGECR